MPLLHQKTLPLLPLSVSMTGIHAVYTGLFCNIHRPLWLLTERIEGIAFNSFYGYYGSFATYVSQEPILHLPLLLISRVCDLDIGSRTARVEPARRREPLFDFPSAFTPGCVRAQVKHKSTYARKHAYTHNT